ncbi:glucose 1-dehydrogenase [bacterium]|nr:glucose 1-dehydrogenase [bacterium]
MKPYSNLFDLSGKVAIVTGASSGLGVTLARGLSAAGAKVVVAARRKSLLENLVNEIRSAENQAISVQCDVTDPQQVELLVNTAMENFGTVDILVNNAGIANVKPLETETLEEFRNVLDVNVTGTFLCTKACGHVMLKAGKGSIINIASIMSFVGIGVIPQAAYNASKGAVVSFTRETAAQWARKGIRLNCIAPGWFPSEMTDEMFATEKGINFLRRQTPMGRPGKPEELLGALLLLSSDASSYITGQTIVVDGGWTII